MTTQPADQLDEIFEESQSLKKFKDESPTSYSDVKQAILDLYIAKAAVANLLPDKRERTITDALGNKFLPLKSEGYNEAIDEIKGKLGLG